jgi:hypothetical protein
VADHVLDIVRRPATAADRIAAKAEGMDANRQPRGRRGLIDLPVALLARRLAGAAQHQHLDEMRIGGVALDFGHRGVGVLIRDDDRPFQARLRHQPLV